jgi:hypothetical protein
MRDQPLLAATDWVAGVWACVTRIRNWPDITIENKILSHRLKFDCRLRQVTSIRLSLTCRSSRSRLRLRSSSIACLPASRVTMLDRRAAASAIRERSATPWTTGRCRPRRPLERITRMTPFATRSDRRRRSTQSGPLTPVARGARGHYRTPRYDAPERQGGQLPPRPPTAGVGWDRSGSSKLARPQRGWPGLLR